MHKYVHIYIIERERERDRDRDRDRDGERVYALYTRMCLYILRSL